MAGRKKTRSIYVTKEPDWKALRLITDVEKQKQAFDNSEYFARTEISSKKKVEATRKWIKEESGWDKEEIKIILANPDWAFSGSSAYWLYYKLGYLPENTLLHTEKRKEDWVTRGKKTILEKKEKQEAKPKKPKISIQERMREQVADLCGQWEELMDNFIDEGTINVKKFDPFKEMQVYQGGIIKPNHAKIIKEGYEGMYAEAKENLEGTCEQLKEAYSFMDKKMKKDYVTFFEKINAACDAIIETGKKQRKPRKKSYNKENMIKKLKFQTNCPELGVASVHPEELIWSNEIWVYNTKTRKVGVYRASSPDPRNLKREGAGLSVKGTTILDFDPDTSMQKTLRKPKEQISNWTGNARTKFAKAFDEVKTTDTKLNGRINEHTLLLKTF